MRMRPRIRVDASAQGPDRRLGCDGAGGRPLAAAEGRRGARGGGWAGGRSAPGERVSMVQSFRVFYHRAVNHHCNVFFRGATVQVRGVGAAPGGPGRGPTGRAPRSTPCANTAWRQRPDACMPWATRKSLRLANHGGGPVGSSLSPCQLEKSGRHGVDSKHWLAATQSRARSRWSLGPAGPTPGRPSRRLALAPPAPIALAGRKLELSHRDRTRAVLAYLSLAGPGPAGLG
jgi:hypothetical protein